MVEGARLESGGESAESVTKPHNSSAERTICHTSENKRSQYVTLNPLTYPLTSSPDPEQAQECLTLPSRLQQFSIRQVLGLHQFRGGSRPPRRPSGRETSSTSSAWHVPYTGGIKYGGVIDYQPKSWGNARHSDRCMREL